jgi:hypothetical protein
MVEAETSGLYYKHITIVNDGSSIVNKFEASLTDDIRVIIYDHHMFIVWPQEFYSHHFIFFATNKWVQ